MRKANRTGAKNVIVVGEDEVRNDEAVIKNMITGTETRSRLEAQELVKIIKAGP
jgi:histidyl-tRNA synthetase